MGKARPRYDVHFWNLDYLETLQLQAVGELRPIFPQAPDAADKIALLQRGEIATLHRRDNVLEVFRLDTHQNFVLHRFDPQEEIVDMAVVRDSLYFWEARGSAIIRLDLSDLKIVSTKRWFLDSGGSRFTRLAVMRGAPGTDAEAYLAPTSAGEVLVVSLRDGLPTRVLPPPLGSQRIGADAHLCVDSRAGSLIVTEPDKQRITEIDTKSGQPKLLWTPNDPTRLDTLGEHFRAGDSRPLAVAIYRTRRIIPQNVLKPTSQVLLESDPSKIRPRTLLIADAGNFCLWKLVQLPESARLLDLSGKTQLLAFLGSGQPRQVTKNYNPNPHRHEQENLRKYMLPPPREVSVSSFGEILVRLDPEYPMLLLRPATSRTESLLSQEAKIWKVDSSD